ncbi:MAG: hypothetical protein J5644_00925 [Bacteroidales bacterium]|nr:hypothetical protein [Bacteroidales bacterium]
MKKILMVMKNFSHELYSQYVLRMAIVLIIISTVSCEKVPVPSVSANTNISILGVWAEDINEDEDGVYDTLIFHPDGSISAVALFDQWKYQLSDDKILFYKDPNYSYPPQIISGDSLTYRYSFISEDTIVFYNFLTLSVASMIFDVKYHKISDL